MSGKKSGDVGSDRIRDIEDVTPTRAPGEREAPTKAETDAVPRPVAPKGTPWFGWLVSILVLGGVGFAVAWFVMHPGGESGDFDAGNAPGSGAVADTEVVKADVETSAAAVADADVQASDGAADTSDAATADASDGAVADASDAAGDVSAVNPDGGLGASADASPIGVMDSVAANVDATVQGDVPVADARPRDPAEARRLNAAGYAARKDGDHEKARALYVEALSFNPDDPTARYNLACELALAGLQKEALAELTTLYKLGTPEARKLLNAARDDADFKSLRDLGQFMRLTR